MATSSDLEMVKFSSYSEKGQSSLESISPFLIIRIVKRKIKLFFNPGAHFSGVLVYIRPERAERRPAETFVHGGCLTTLPD